MVLVAAVLFVVGLAVLVKGADLFIEGAARTAKALGISAFVIGLTLVALGTSLPELASALLASYYNVGELAVGAIVGSNIANATLILGVSALLIGKVTATKKIFDKDCAVMLVAAVLFYALGIDGVLSALDGVVMLCFFAAYIAMLFGIKPNIASIFSPDTYLWLLHRPKETRREMPKKKLESKSVLMILIGVVGIAAGAQLVVENALVLAEFFNVSNTFIGLTLVAAGTSLPELVVSFTTIKKRLGGILLGNVLGSNIANLLVVAALAALVNPLAVVESAVALPMVFMIITSTILLMAVYGDWHIDRKEAGFMLLLYALFIYAASTWL